MSFEFNNESPIYLQIIEHIKLQIISSQYLPNQKLKSVREMSVEYGVNPNTIQKALFELEQMGLIFTERTNGKFVTTNEETIRKIKEQTLQKMVDDFFDSMQKIGIDKEQTIAILNKERK